VKASLALHAKRRLRPSRKTTVANWLLAFPTQLVLVPVERGQRALALPKAKLRLRTRRRKPPPQTWRSFFRNHTQDLVSIDFFVVPTATFRILYVFLVLEHERRRIVRFNVTGGRPPSGQVSNR